MMTREELVQARACLLAASEQGSTEVVEVGLRLLREVIQLQEALGTFLRPGSVVVVDRANTPAMVQIIRDFLRDRTDVPTLPGSFLNRIEPSWTRPASRSPVRRRHELRRCLNSRRPIRTLWGCEIGWPAPRTRPERPRPPCEGLHPLSRPLPLRQPRCARPHWARHHLQSPRFLPSRS